VARVPRRRHVRNAFHGYIRGLFQPSRKTQLPMSEAVETEPEALNHLLTEAVVDQEGPEGSFAVFCRRYPRESADWLNDPEPAISNVPRRRCIDDRP